MTAPERIELRELREDLVREIHEQRREFREEIEKLHQRISGTADALIQVRSLHDACQAARLAERRVVDPWANWVRSLLLVMITSVLTLAGRDVWEKLFP